MEYSKYMSKLYNPDACFTTIIDEHGNKTFFMDGFVPSEYNGGTPEIISVGLSWQEAHDWINE